MELKWPAIHSEVYRTRAGTPYLREPGVVLISQPTVNLGEVQAFLDGFDAELGFAQYLQDPVYLTPAEALTKAAGQLCYMSFGPKRTTNAEASKYLTNIKSSGHGSVLEHANFSLLCYGISRSVTHELVRHRAGFGFSQVSQRYVSGKVLRFVERPEYVNNAWLHGAFLDRADRSAREYEAVARYLLKLQEDGESQVLSAEAKTDRRKKVQQAARSVLPNETEAPIVVTANARGWRHFCEMRANEHAEVEIRALAMRAFRCLVDVAPIVFDDYSVTDLPDGTQAVSTQFRKV